jgi:integral membrane protein
VGAALTRYRVIAYVVGVVLILFVAVAIPLKYIWDQPAMGQVVAPMHGFLYMVYLVAVFDLGRRAKWPLSRMVLLMLAGTIPFVSFYAERVVTRSAGKRPQDQDRTPATIAG